MDGLNLQERQQNQENQRKIEEYAKKAKKCPKCKSVMYCYEVNTTSRNQIGGDWKSQWICGNPDCGHEEFSIRSVDQEMRMLGLGG